MRRGISTSIQTIVVLTLAVLVLALLVIFFTGQARGLFSAIADLSSVGRDGAYSAARDAEGVIETGFGG